MKNWNQALTNNKEEKTRIPEPDDKIPKTKLQPITRMFKPVTKQKETSNQNQTNSPKPPSHVPTVKPEKLPVKKETNTKNQTPETKQKPITRIFTKKTKQN